MYGFLVDASNSYHEGGIFFMTHIADDILANDYNERIHQLFTIYYKACKKAMIECEDGGQPEDNTSLWDYFEDVHDCCDMLCNERLEFAKEVFETEDDLIEDFIEYLTDYCDYDTDFVEDKDVVEVE